MAAMSFLDVLVLVLTLAFAVLAPRLSGRSRLTSFLTLAIGFALQLAVEGFYWQWLPAYAVALASAAPRLARKAPAGRVRRWAGRLALAAAVLIVIAPWLVFVPVPNLPEPTGPYAVGTQTFRWVDGGRPETATSDPNDRRNVIAQDWYPTEADDYGQRSYYIDGLGHLPKSVSLMPSFVMGAYDRIDTHASEGAPLPSTQQTWPVLLFSPGYGAPRAAYTGLAAELASRGFVVLALDHPYEAAVTQLADGRIATPADNFPADEARQGAWMSDQQDLRAADMSFVLDQITRADALGPRLSGRLDLARIAAAGHSFGGATAALALSRDQRLKAAINIDGTPYGDLPDQRLTRPFMLIESDRAETGPGERYLAGNQRLLNNLAAPGSRFQIKRANHYSFTDAPLFLAPPARFVLSRLIGGERGPVETQRVTVGLIAAFVGQAMTGAQDGPTEAGYRYADVTGGRTWGVSQFEIQPH
jgi:dienelactone hydrolase